mgnify:CR=1 FL=1
MKLYITRHGETKRNKEQRVLGRTDDPLSEKGLKMVNEMDDYIIEHFRIAFGNRIMKQMTVYI